MFAKWVHSLITPCGVSHNPIPSLYSQQSSLTQSLQHKGREDVCGLCVFPGSSGSPLKRPWRTHIAPVSGAATYKTTQPGSGPRKPSPPWREESSEAARPSNGPRVHDSTDHLAHTSPFQKRVFAPPFIAKGHSDWFSPEQRDNLLKKLKVRRLKMTVFLVSVQVLEHCGL